MFRSQKKTLKLKDDSGNWLDEMHVWLRKLTGLNKFRYLVALVFIGFAASFALFPANHIPWRIAGLVHPVSSGQNYVIVKNATVQDSEKLLNELIEYGAQSVALETYYHRGSQENLYEYSISYRLFGENLPNEAVSLHQTSPLRIFTDIVAEYQGTPTASILLAQSERRLRTYEFAKNNASLLSLSPSDTYKAFFTPQNIDLSAIQTIDSTNISHMKHLIPDAIVIVETIQPLGNDLKLLGMKLSPSEALVVQIEAVMLGGAYEAPILITALLVFLLVQLLFRASVKLVFSKLLAITILVFVFACVSHAYWQMMFYSFHFLPYIWGYVALLTIQRREEQSPYSKLYVLNPETHFLKANTSTLYVARISRFSSLRNPQSKRAEHQVISRLIQNIKNVFRNIDIYEVRPGLFAWMLPMKSEVDAVSLSRLENTLSESDYRSNDRRLAVTLAKCTSNEIPINQRLSDALQQLEPEMSNLVRYRPKLSSDIKRFIKQLTTGISVDTHVIPRVDLQERCVIGFELKLGSITCGTDLSDEIYAVIEELNLNKEASTALVDEAISQITKSVNPLDLSVRLSSMSLSSSYFVEHMKMRSKLVGFNVGSINLEVNVDKYSGFDARLMDSIIELKECGFRVSLRLSADSNIPVELLGNRVLDSIVLDPPRGSWQNLSSENSLAALSSVCTKNSLLLACTGALSHDDIAMLTASGIQIIEASLSPQTTHHATFDAIWSTIDLAALQVASPAKH